MVVFRNKETGRLYSMIGSCSSSSGSFYYLATDPQNDEEEPVVQVPIEKILTDFEVVSDKIDYSTIFEQLITYVHLNPEINDLLNAFLRRNTADYYVPGKYVYVSSMLDPTTHSCPEDCIYIIKELRVSYNNGQELVLKKANSKREQTISFKMNLDKIVRGDAYNCVKRLDMPY